MGDKSGDERRVRSRALQTSVRSTLPARKTLLSFLPLCEGRWKNRQPGAFSGKENQVPGVRELTKVRYLPCLFIRRWVKRKMRALMVKNEPPTAASRIQPIWWPGEEPTVTGPWNPRVVLVGRDPQKPLSPSVTPTPSPPPSPRTSSVQPRGSAAHRDEPGLSKPSLSKCVLDRTNHL